MPPPAERCIRVTVDNAGTFVECRYEGGIGLRGVIAGPLVADKEVWSARQQMRDFDRAANHEPYSDAVVDGLRCCESAERVLPRIESGIVENETEASVVEAPGVEAAIAESLIQGELRGGCVVHTAIDEEAIRALLVSSSGGFGISCVPCCAPPLSGFCLLAVCKADSELRAGPGQLWRAPATDRTAEA